MVLHIQYTSSLNIFWYHKKCTKRERFLRTCCWVTHLLELFLYLTISFQEESWNILLKMVPMGYIQEALWVQVLFIIYCIYTLYMYYVCTTPKISNPSCCINKYPLILIDSRLIQMIQYWFSKLIICELIIVHCFFKLKRWNSKCFVLYKFPKTLKSYIHTYNSCKSKTFCATCKYKKVILCKLPWCKALSQAVHKHQFLNHSHSGAIVQISSAIFNRIKGATFKCFTLCHSPDFNTLKTFALSSISLQQ